MIGAIVLAAGRGRRFGYTSKLLARFDGAAVISHVLSAADAAPMRPIVLVTGRRHAAVARVGRRCIQPSRRLRVVRNRAWRQGLARSLQLGVTALPARCDAALICLGDMPLIDTQTITRLCVAWHDGLDYVRPVHRGQPGHPVLVSRTLFDDFAALHGDHGAQPLLTNVPAARRRLLSGRNASVTDIDTPGRLRRAQRIARCRRRRMPTSE